MKVEIQQLKLNVWLELRSGDTSSDQLSRAGASPPRIGGIGGALLAGR